MSRYIFWGAVFYFILRLQSGFFASLPPPWPLLPLALAAGVYLLQHQGIKEGAVLIFLNGLYLDWTGLQSVRLETVSYGLTALSAAYLARHIFSNRSLWGVLSCGIAAFAVLKILQFLILTASGLQSGRDSNVNLFVAETWQALALLLVCLIILFTLAGRMSFLKKKSVILPTTNTF